MAIGGVMIINVIDMVDGAGKYQKQDLMQMGYKHFVELHLMSNGLQQMKTQIKLMAGIYSITVLRVFGHGAPGIQNVSLGTCFSGYTKEDSTIMLSTLGSLSELKRYFAPNARVELWGCEVANDQGKMISALANLWDVRVQATTVKPEGHLSWDKVVEARPGICGLFHIKPVPLKLHK